MYHFEDYSRAPTVALHFWHNVATMILAMVYDPSNPILLTVGVPWS